MAPVEQYGTPILEVVAGSHAYGTNVETSDLDRRGVMVLHPKHCYGMQGVDEYHVPGEDTVYYSLQKFARLAADGNPSILELLFVEPQHVLYASPEGRELLDIRHRFLSRSVFGRFGAYARSQLEKLIGKKVHHTQGAHREFVERYGYDTKHAMHLVRLLQSGIEILLTGDLHTYRPNREELLAIRHGKYTLEELRQYAQELERQLEEAMRVSRLPDVPDLEAINHWVVAATNRVHGVPAGTGMMPRRGFRVLPLEYAMVENCTVCLLGNRLVRRRSREHATGIAVPYRDWYVGLYEFSEFKFGETVIDSVHKAVSRTLQCHPRALDLAFAAREHFLFDTDAGIELRAFLRTLVTRKALENTILGFVRGSLRAMEHWEGLKRAAAERGETAALPADTPPDRARVMIKYGYDTVRAWETAHALLMGVELAETGTMADSRRWTQDLYAIRHGLHPTFESFRAWAHEMTERFQAALARSPLPARVDRKAVDAWLIEFVQGVHAR